MTCWFVNFQINGFQLAVVSKKISVASLTRLQKSMTKNGGEIRKRRWKQELDQVPGTTASITATLSPQVMIRPGRHRLILNDY